MPKSFRIGFIVTLSFMLILMVVATTIGFFPPPTGPKAPIYPTYPTGSTLTYGTTLNSPEETKYQNDMKKYQDDQKSYQDEQKNFVKDKIVPYAKGVLSSWVLAIIIFEVVGILLVKFGSPLVGSSFAFVGFWAVLFGPLGSFFWLVGSLVSSFAGRANQDYSLDPIFKMLAIVLLLGCVVLTLLGIFMIDNLNLKKRAAPRTAAQN
ncbi:MAG TPA: hypothetical protein VG965_00980 [Patescibacteria group bacterium]|nr:hypothetical protein [Patescibacteria group bacterium]